MPPPLRPEAGRIPDRQGGLSDLPVPSPFGEKGQTEIQRSSYGAFIFGLQRVEGPSMVVLLLPLSDILEGLTRLRAEAVGNRTDSAFYLMRRMGLSCIFRDLMVAHA